MEKENIRFFIQNRKFLSFDANKISKESNLNACDVAPSLRTVNRWLEAFKAG